MPEHLANRVLSGIPFDGTLPINIVKLIKDYGVMLEKCELTEHCRGISIPVANNKHVIVLSSLLSEIDARFVLAHELYHYLDWSISPNKNLAKFYMYHPDRRIERQANRFAAKLLVPDAPLCSLHKLGKTNEELARIFGVRPCVIAARLKHIDMT